MVAQQRNDRMANTTLSDYNFQNEISHVVNTIEVEKPPITQEKINQVLDHIQDADKAADVSVAMQRQFHPRSNAGDCCPIREELEKRPDKWIWIGPPIQQT